MLQAKIRNDDFFSPIQRHKHCCDIASNAFNIVPTLRRCVALKSSLRIVSCNITLMLGGESNEKGEKNNNRSN